MVVLKKRVVCGLVILLALLSATFASASPLPLWEIDSARGQVFIMGSVHFLRPSDYPLRPGLDTAFRMADKIIMEINMAEVDPVAAQTTIAGMSIDPAGRSLRDIMGETKFRQAEQLAADIGIPLLMFENFEPWFAALSITQLRMVQLGFDPSWGIETILTRRAVQEGKQLAGLETTEEQLGFLDRLDTDTQSRFLLQSLEDAATVADEAESIVAAWKRGDTKSLEHSLLKGLDEAPKLYAAILVQRNRNWVEPIRALLNEEGTTLIVVGTMHLVGEDSVLALLDAKGIQSRQLSDSDFANISP